MEKKKPIRKLKACLSCSLIKPAILFRQVGCENCPFLGMKNNQDAVLDCTSDRFNGMIHINDLNKSWIAKWQRLDSCKQKGTYAITVEGELPEYYIERMEKEGREYFIRNKPFRIN